jgi:hypothetical protein
MSFFIELATYVYVVPIGVVDIVWAVEDAVKDVVPEL